MKKILIFIVVLAAAVAFLAIELAWYTYVYQAGMGGLTGTMSQMMGSQYPNMQMSTMPSYVFATLTALIVLIVIGIGGFAYYVAYPQIVRVASEIRNDGRTTNAQPIPAESPDSTKETWAVLIRTSNPDERKVLEVLSAHGGKYLQKFIVKESGLSKLRTHRIVARFSDRGIVMVSKTGNTNEVALSRWLLDNGNGKSFQNSPVDTHK